MPVVERFNPIKSPSLYTLTGELSDAIADLYVDEETGEVVGAERLDALAMDTQEKVLACARAVKNFDVLLKSMKDAKHDLESRIRSTERIMDTIKSRCLDAMRVLDTKSIKAADIAVSARRSEQVDVFDESLVGAEFWTEKVTRTVSKTAIKDAIKAGADVQGARLVPNLTLTIKG